MAIGGRLVKWSAPILSSGGESFGGYATINDIIPSGRVGSVSSHTLNPALAPPRLEREEETKEEEDPCKSLRGDTNTVATIPMCDPPETVSTCIVLPQSDYQCSSVDSKKVIWFWCVICDCSLANIIDRDFNIGRCNDHKNQAQHVTALTKNKNVDDLNKREKSGDKLTEIDKKKLNFGKK